MSIKAHEGVDWHFSVDIFMPDEDIINYLSHRLDDFKFYPIVVLRKLSENKMYWRIKLTKGLWHHALLGYGKENADYRWFHVFR